MTKELYNYKYYKSSDKFQRQTGRLNYLVDLIKGKKPSKVLDVGCGIGYLTKRLNKERIQTIGIDFSDDLEEFWGDDDNFFQMDAKNIDFPNKSFDIVFSTDFFEHIPEDQIDQVVKEMKRVGKKVIAFVADDIGEILTERQKLYHCTHKKFTWWKKKLEGIEVYSSHI